MVRSKSRCVNGLHLWVTVAGLCVASSAAALDPNRTIDQYAREVWGRKDGLTTGRVMSLYETSDGYLWLGCRFGLARFDGVGFTAFKAGALGLKQFSFVRDLMGDSNGLLLGGAVGGVIRFDGSTFTFLNEDQGLVHPFVYALAPGTGDAVWVGTGGDGLWELNRNTFKRNPNFQRADLSAQINDLAIDADGSLWAATDKGAIALSDKIRKVTTDDGLPSDIANTLMFDREGALWVGTRAGLARLQDGDAAVFTTFHGLSHDNVTALLEDRDGNVWIGTSGGGLHRFRDGCIESANDSRAPSGGGIFSLYEDRGGSLWVGTDQGVERIRSGAFITFGRLQGFTGERLFNIEPRKQGGLFVLDASGAIYVFENGRATMVAEEGTVTGDGMFDLAVANDGSLYIGGPKLLRFQDGRIEPFPSPGGDITVVVEDEPGLLIATTSEMGTSRLYHFDRGVFEQIHADVPLVHVQRIRRDKSGRLWVSTSGKGIARIDSRGARFFTTKDGLPSDVVYETLEDETGDVWVSTRSGLARIRKDLVFGFLGIENAPTESPVHLTEDGLGFLFVTADDGIHRIALSDLRAAADGRIGRVNAEVFDALDGLFSEEISWRPSAVAALSDGRIYFAGNLGLSVVNPAELKPDRPLPKARIESVTIDNENFLPASSIAVASGVERIRFQYTAPDLSDGDHLRFRYRLSGYADKWTDLKAPRIAEFTHLSQGDYMFEVAAGRGAAFGEAAKLSVRVEARWYETWIAKGLFGLILVSMLAAFYRLRIRQLRRRERQF